MTIEVVMVFLLPTTAYLLGSFPSAYIWTRYRRKADIYQLGTGNSGASNVFRSVGTMSGLLVMLFDSMIKGFLPTLFFLWLDIPIWTLLLSSLSLVAGHNWSVFMRFKGGRGVATSIGVVLGVGMWWQMLIMAIGPGLIGRGLIYKDSAPWTIASLLMLITLALIHESQIYIIWLLIGLLSLMVLKRLMSNSGIPFFRRDFFSVMFFRIIFDRDVMSKRDWINCDPA
mgnify:CR=1 FL=1